jgi:hypothetical protein
MKKTIVGAAAAVLVLFAGSAGHAQQDGILGVLTCHKDAKTEGVTYLFHSRHSVTCTYEGAGASRKYEGTSGILLGIDLDYQMEDGMAYIVMGFGSPSSTLAGSYVGAKATLRIGGGVSAQAGLGGAGNGVFLVPLGIGGGVGLGAAAGIGYLNLTKAK